METYDSALLPSDQNFGLLISAVLGGLVGYGFWNDWTSQILGIMTIFALLAGGITIIAPSTLRPLNQAWFKLGVMLGRIANPVILGVIFFGVLTPVALAGRLWGRDELCLKRQVRDSYWINSPTGQLDLESFKRQY